MDEIDFKKDLFVSLALFVPLLIFSMVDFSGVAIKPNLFLAVLVAVALLIESWPVFLGFLIAEIAWLKFTPFLIPEYAVVFLLGLAAFVLSKLLIFRKILAVRVFLVFVIQAAFWIVVSSPVRIVSLVFVLELIYNVIIEEILFAFGTWLKKKFS